MGIHHFFHWFKSQFSKNMPKVKIGENRLKNNNVDIDVFMIDMNGIFHTSAQKVYEYGNYKPRQRLINRRPTNFRQNKDLAVFKDVCDTVEELFYMVNPNKKLLLCVDGPAPLSKQNQQRQRRYRSAKEREDDNSFDSTCISPGTKFMDHLTKYIDFFIKKKISENSRWQNVEIVFSNEKVAGEGEHKIINYIRNHGDRTDTYCIHGMDADLIMLALGTHIPNFYILREDTYNGGFFCIKISTIRGELIDIIRWESDEHSFNPEWAINDFIFLCFMVGNDFLPRLPSLEIIQGGIEIILDVYREVCTEHGHITNNVDGNIIFVKDSMEVFLTTIGMYEKDSIEVKLNSKESFFPDELVESCSTLKDGVYTIDIKKYREEHIEKTKKYKEKTDYSCKDITTEKICHDYFEGMQWVLSYYTRGVPNWKWNYKYHYAPCAGVLAKHLSTFEFPEYGKTNPSTPYQQLLCIIPPKSAYLIPSPLNILLTSDNSPIKKYCPDDFEIDLSGKRKEWEGITILPQIDFEVLRRAYFEKIGDVKPVDLKRNMYGKSVLYKFERNFNRPFKSYYGDIERCSVKVSTIEL